MKLAAAMSPGGSPDIRNAMAPAAVITVTTHGVSKRLRRARLTGSSPSSDSWARVRDAPARGCMVPWNMLETMSHTAAALAAPARSGANVAPSDLARSPLSGPGPSTPSHTTGRTTKYRLAAPAETSMARGTLRSKRTVSPTWQVAASNAGAANPTRYRPAMALVTAANGPWKGRVRWKLVARRQSTRPASTGTAAARRASDVDRAPITTDSRVTQRMPSRLTTVKTKTMAAASHLTPTPGRYHSWMAVAENRAVNPQVGTHPHQ